MAESVEERLGGLMTERGWTLSVAETTAGGLICARIVGVSGSSAWFERGVVAYSSAAKIQWLGISESLLERHGTVSGEAAAAMAAGVGRAGRSTLGLAETGIAGPIQGRSPKPLGTAYIGLWTPGGVRCERFVFEGDRRRIREGIAEKALAITADYVQDAA